MEGTPSSTWVEGERGTVGPSEFTGTAFPCVLFLPQAPEQNEAAVSWKPRTVTRPTLLFDPLDVVAGQMPGKDHDLLISAPDLAAFTGGDAVIWQVDGAPQPAGPPGRPIVVVAILKRVRD